MLELKFMGPPEVLYGSKPLKFATRKALALFAYLVVEPSAHPREKLMSIFWPESEAHLAQSALRNTLARIKEALRGVDRLAPLRMEGDRIRINISTASTLDLDLVTWATTESQRTKSAPPDIVQLENAANALRGPFMDGFSLPDAPAFDEWLTIQRANWGHRQNLVYDHLSLYQLENHLIGPAIETVIRWVILDHLNETAYQRLMRLHFLNGDRSAALQAYETCRDLLTQELGVKPSPETEEMLAYIRSAQAPAPVFSAQAEAQRAALHIPFVGRSNEYQGLIQSFRLATKGKLQVVVVSGKSGIGKTRLSEEFLKWAGTEGADILRGRAFETSGQLLPYQPVIDTLRERLERENAPDDLLDDVWLVELSRILPELRERYPDLPLATGDDSTARTRLFEAIARLTQALCTRRPLVWLMDDLQWADAETMELLHYLNNNWQKNHVPILLLILMRSEALGYGSTLRDWMSGLTRDIPITRFTLSEMTAEDLQQLIFSLAGENAAGASDLSAWLTAETAGQPFFLTETLTALDEFGALVWDGKTPARKLNLLDTLANLKSMGSQTLAPAIRDVVLSRLEWLSQSASSMLAAAAVIGRNCSFEFLIQVSGTDEQDSLNALDELRSARMILEARNESQPYTISHDRIREIVYAQLSEARQHIFHRRALAALTEAKAPPAELAHHALSAKEWQLAFDHSLRAGDEAMRLFAVAGATHHYETARALLNQNKAEVDHVICQHLYTRLGQAYELEFRHRKALDVYEEMQAQASIRKDRRMELAALVARCIILPMPYETQDVELAKQLVDQALPLAQALEDLKAQTQIELSLVRIYGYYRIETEPVLLHIRAAEALARKAGLREQLGLIMFELGVVTYSMGELEQSKSALLESVDIYRELDNHPRVMKGLHSLAVVCMIDGKFDAALTFLQESLQANEALGSLTEFYAMATTRGTIHALQGEYGRELDGLLPALELDDSQFLSGLRTDILQQIAWCYYDLGAYEEGLKYCRRAINEDGHVSYTGNVAAFTILALLQTARGELLAADAAVVKGWQNYDIQWVFYSEADMPSILEAEARLRLAQGDLIRSARCIELLLEKYDGMKLRHFKPGILYLRAEIELAAGKKENAYQTLSEALALSDEIGAHREVWAMCSMLSKLEAERGNELASVQLHRRACEEAMFIAGHAGTALLREIFLARTDVQLILGA